MSDTYPESEVALVVRGGRPLTGDVAVGGFKHSLVTAVAAAACGTQPTRIQNAPQIGETRVMMDLVEHLGGRATFSGTTLTVDPRDIADGSLDTPLVDAAHGAVYLAPSVLSRRGEVSLTSGGGCQIGNLSDGRRPYAHYADVLGRFGGVETVTSDGYSVKAKQLRGCTIDLLDFAGQSHRRSGPLYSGATKMALLGAVIASGTTLLKHPYPKPDVSDLVDLLIAMGADIERDDGSLVVHASGPASLCKGPDFELTADLIEVVTWITAFTLIGSRGHLIGGAGMPRAIAALAPEFKVLSDLGVEFSISTDTITVTKAESLDPVQVLVESRGVFSDSHPFFSLLASVARGTSSIRETVWARRFGYVGGLVKLGAQLSVSGDTVYIHGPAPCHVAGTQVHAPDLRAAAVLVIAALTVEGDTTISGASHLARGYPDLARSLNGLGARIDSGNAP